jgi:hypothetical protein
MCVLLSLSQFQSLTPALDRFMAEKISERSEGHHLRNMLSTFALTLFQHWTTISTSFQHLCKSTMI